VQNMEEQLRQTLEELATEKTTNKAKDNYMTTHLAQMQQAFMVIKHSTNHTMSFSDIYVLRLCNYKH
jgi:hypothetical protein